MDRVLLGKSLPEILSLRDKRIPPSSSGSVDCGTTGLVRDVGSRKLRGGTGDTAHRRSSELAVRWASNIDCDYPWKLGRTNELTHYPEQMRENVRKFDVKKAADSWNKIRDLRHTIIQYLLKQNRLGTGEDETIEREEDV